MEDEIDEENLEFAEMLNDVDRDAHEHKDIMRGGDKIETSGDNIP